MKVKITKWDSITWYWLNRKELEGKEFEVLNEVESQLIKGKISYLIKEPNLYIPASSCELVKEGGNINCVLK